MKRCFLLLLIACSALASFAHVTPTSAQDRGFNITTSPLPINLVTTPGNTVTTDLRIKNSGSETEELKVGLMKFSAFGLEGKPQLLDRAPEDEYFDWVSFSEDSFVAEPNVWKTIEMTIKVPDSAAFGYYYAVTFSRTEPTENQEDTAAVEGATSVLVLLEVDAPGARKSLDLNSFRTTSGIYEFLPVTFEVTLQNTGNIHLIPTGTIFVNKGGQEVAQIDFNAGAGNVLPDSGRSYKAEWSDGFPVYQEKLVDGRAVNDSNGQVKKELVWDFDSSLSKLRFGKYTATLVAVYDDGARDVPLEATVSFWVIPWRILAIIPIIIGVPAFLGYKYYRMRKRLKAMTAKEGNK